MPHQSFSTFHFNYNAMQSIPYYGVFAADTLRDTVTLNICRVSSAMWWNSVPNMNAIEQSTVELLHFQ